MGATHWTARPYPLALALLDGTGPLVQARRLRDTGRRSRRTFRQRAGVDCAADSGKGMGREVAQLREYARPCSFETSCGWPLRARCGCQLAVACLVRI